MMGQSLTVLFMSHSLLLSGSCLIVRSRLIDRCRHRDGREDWVVVVVVTPFHLQLQTLDSSGRKMTRMAVWRKDSSGWDETRIASCYSINWCGNVASPARKMTSGESVKRRPGDDVRGNVISYLCCFAFVGWQSSIICIYRSSVSLREESASSFLHMYLHILAHAARDHHHSTKLAKVRIICVSVCPPAHHDRALYSPSTRSSSGNVLFASTID